MVVIAAIVLIGFAIIALFAIAVVAVIVSLISSLVRATHPKRPQPQPQVATAYEGEPYDISDLEDAEFNAIVAREWPTP